jgi:hypothetical protein
LGGKWQDLHDVENNSAAATSSFALAAAGSWPLIELAKKASAPINAEAALALGNFNRNINLILDLVLFAVDSICTTDHILALTPQS